MESKLPNLPGSDERTLRDNSYDSFYEKRSSDIWGGHVEHIKLKKQKKCDHYFIKKEDNSALCVKCHMGLEGETLTIQEGHVFFGNQKLI